MLKDKIEATFQKYPEVRVLFYFDPDGDSKEEVVQMEETPFRILQYANNPLDLKIRFRSEYADDRVFLYVPAKRPDSQEEYLRFPLLDLLVANRELRLDNVGEFMEDFRLKPHQRHLVQQYIRELKYESVQKVLEPVLHSSRFEEKSLRQGLLCAFLRLTKPEPYELILAKMITLALESEENELRRFANKVKDNQLMDLLDQQSIHYFGESLREITRERLQHLASITKYNAMTADLEADVKADPYIPLRITEEGKRTAQQNLLERALQSPAVREKFLLVLDTLASQVREQKLVSIYGIEAKYGWYSPALVSHLHHAIAEAILSKKITGAESLNRISLWERLSGNLKHVNQFLLHTLDTLQRIARAGSFILDKPEEYTQRYTGSWHGVDTAYRKAIVAWRDMDQSELISGEVFERLKNRLEDQYTAFVEGTNREWLKCLAEKNFEYRSIPIPKQYDFYESEILRLDQKVAVIISDGLRYEVASELLKELHQETKTEASLKYSLASIPSETAIGMSNLLPGKIRVMDGEKIKIDGIPSDALINREKILRNREADSRAVSYSQLDGMSQLEARQLFKSKVVYVYHDVIDAIGHKKASERNVLPMVPAAIDELKKLVKYLHSSLNVNRVLVTADHGFIYTDRANRETDFEPDMKNDLNLELQTNRYGFLDKEEKPESGYCFPFTQTNVVSHDKFVVIPPSVNRYHRQGATVQYVHGGGSLQELIVPVIESKYRKNKPVERVNPVLLTRSPRVVSNSLRIQLLQENPVSKDEKERVLNVGLYDGNDLASNLVEIKMNSPADSPSQRIYTADLVLLPGEGDKNRFTLRVFDPEDTLNRLIETEVTNNTLYGADF